MGLLKKITKKRFHRRYGWHGDYANWRTAQAAAGGYDDALILQRVRAAALAVTRGEAVFERDSVLFHEPRHNWPLLAALLWVAARDGGKLSVVDFGGSLGSTWYQNRPMLGALTTRWTIVEQPHYVAAGRADFEDDILRFADTIEEAVKSAGTRLFLASSVLQYLEDPAAVLAAVRTHRFATVLIDRTAVTKRPASRITVQRVPEKIYPASYPARFLSHDDLIGRLEDDYETVAQWQAMFDRTQLQDCGFEGYLLRRRSRTSGSA